MAGFGWVSSWLGGGAPESDGQAPQAFGFRNPWRTEDDAGTVAAVQSSAATPLSTATGSADAAERHEVAEAVRAVGKKKLQDAWRKLRSEFDVTRKIWESVAISEGERDRRAERERLSVSIQGALKAADRQPVGATKLLSPILQGLGASAAVEPLLNQATVTAAQNVIKAERRLKLHEKLAGLIQSAAMELGRQESNHSELESMLATCKLQDKSLESRARRILGMGASKEEKAKAAKEAKAAQEAALEKQIRQVAEVAGVSRDHARKAIANSGGDPDLALIMLLSDPDEAAKREKRIEKKAVAEEQKRVASEVKAIAKMEASEAKIAEAKALALSIAKLASSTQKMAWAKVRTEFDVQLKIWETQALLCASNGGTTVSYAETQSEIKGVLVAAERDPRGAVMMLEMVLQKAEERGLELCTGMISAADETLDADSVATYRRELAGCLRDAAKSLEDGRGVPKRGSARDLEVSELIPCCQLKDSNMGIQIKMLLDPRNVSL